MPQTADETFDVTFRPSPDNENVGYGHYIPLDSVIATDFDWVVEIHWPGTEWRYPGVDDGLAYDTYIKEYPGTARFEPGRFNEVTFMVEGTSVLREIFNRVFRLKGTMTANPAVVIYPVMGYIVEDLGVQDHPDGTGLLVSEVNQLISEESNRKGWAPIDNVRTEIENKLNTLATQGPQIVLGRRVIAFDTALAPEATRVFTSVWDGLGVWKFTKQGYKVNQTLFPAAKNAGMLGIHLDPTYFSVAYKNNSIIDPIPAGAFLELWAQDVAEVNPVPKEREGTKHTATYTLATDLLPNEVRLIEAPFDIEFTESETWDGYDVYQLAADKDKVYYQVAYTRYNLVAFNVWAANLTTGLPAGTVFTWECYP